MSRATYEPSRFSNEIVQNVAGTYKSQQTVAGNSNEYFDISGRLRPWFYSTFISRLPVKGRKQKEFFDIFFAVL
jgi:hypothetical protein